MIRSRLLRRLGPPVGNHPEVTSNERLAAASDDIRNALVPLTTVADLLRRPLDEDLQGWCAGIVRREVEQIVSILESFSGEKA